MCDSFPMECSRVSVTERVGSSGTSGTGESRLDSMVAGGERAFCLARSHFALTGGSQTSRSPAVLIFSIGMPAGETSRSIPERTYGAAVLSVVAAWYSEPLFLYVVSTTGVREHCA